MLTRNFLTAFGNAKGLNLDDCPGAKLIDGSTSYIRVEFGTGTVYCFMDDGNWAKAKFVIGNGITKPNISDYRMESEITGQSYNCSSPLQKKYIQGEEKDYLNISGIITNTGTENIEFSEVGLIGYISTGSNYILLAREVYDTPITVKPGQSVAVNINTL